MIRKLEVENFKRFRKATFDLDDRLVIVGPNNCGKTTFLQAISLWAEAWRRWSEDEDASRWLRDGVGAEVRTSEHGYVMTSVADLRSVSVLDFAELWHNKNVRDPVVLEMHTRDWRVALELRFRNSSEIAACPAGTVPAKELHACVRRPLSIVHVPSALRIEDDEAELAENVLPHRLSSGRGASVLRNMLLHLSSNDWRTLDDGIRSLFGYAIIRPSKSDPLRVYYRHSEADNLLEVSCAGSGFLQVLLLYSSLLYRRSNVVLVDEPDMHLHRLLQNEVYSYLDRITGLLPDKDSSNQARHSPERRNQLIVSTHSDVLVDNVDPARLRSMTATELIGVRGKVLKDALRFVTNSQVHTALAEGRILYVEGDTDVPILRAWAKTIGHRLLSFLERPFVEHTAEREEKAFAQRHYRALAIIVPSLSGIELRDRNRGGLSRNNRDKAFQQTPPRIYWQRYEIENYLVHGDAILRLVERRGGKAARTRADAHIERTWPRMVVEEPFEDNPFHEAKGKGIIAPVMESAGLPWNDRECVAIAEEMTAAEVHPEVKEKLDQIATKLDWHNGVRTNPDRTKTSLQPEGGP